MEWLTRNWIAALVVGAVVFNIVDNRRVAADRSAVAAEAVRVAAIKSCIESSERSALVVAYKERTAQAAGDRGEEGLERTYRALARGGLLLIPIPATRGYQREFLTELKSEPLAAAVLSDRARALIREGCEEDYRAP